MAQPVYHGYLVKRALGKKHAWGTDQTSWRKRYFVLTSDKITWFESAEVTTQDDGKKQVTLSSKPLGYMRIDQSSSLIKNAEKTTEMDNTFTISSPPYVLALQAASEDERDEWVHKLEMVIDVMEGTTTLTSTSDVINLIGAATEVLTSDAAGNDPPDVDKSELESSVSEDTSSYHVTAGQQVSVEGSPEQGRGKGKVSLQEVQLQIASDSAHSDQILSGTGDSTMRSLVKQKTNVLMSARDLRELKIQKQKFINVARGQVRVAGGSHVVHAALVGTRLLTLTGVSTGQPSQMRQEDCNQSAGSPS